MVQTTCTRGGPAVRRNTGERGRGITAE